MHHHVFFPFVHVSATDFTKQVNSV